MPSPWLTTWARIKKAGSIKPIHSRLKQRGMMNFFVWNSEFLAEGIYKNSINHFIFMSSFFLFICDIGLGPTYFRVLFVAS